MTSPPLQNVTASNTSKGRPRRHFAECRTSGGRRRPTKSKPTLPLRTQKCSSAPSRKSAALPSHAPRRSCQLTAQPCLRRRAALTQGGGDTSVPCSTTVDSTVLDQIQQKPVITSLDLQPPAPLPTIDEVSKATRQTSSGKSPGMDGIPAGIFKSAGPVALEALQSLLTSIWSGKKRRCPKKSRVPHSFLCSRTGAVRLTVATSRTSLSCPSLGRSRLGSSSAVSSPTSRRKNLPEDQYGFRPNRSTTDMIFSLRQVQEKCIEQNVDLIAVFIDLTKAFDTVNREALRVILSKTGVPDQVREPDSPVPRRHDRTGSFRR